MFSGCGWKILKGKKLLYLGYDDLVVRDPSKKGGDVLRLLRSLGYRVERTRGSHHRLVAPGRPPLVFAFHRRTTVPPRALRHILEREIGLSEDEIVELLWGGRPPGGG